MSINQFLLREETYTLNNAMAWGIFKEHCHQVKQGKLSNGAKCCHITMAALEFLPVLSQLVSLVEYCVNKIFNYAKSIIVKEHHVDASDLAHRLEVHLQDRHLREFGQFELTLLGLQEALSRFSETGNLAECIGKPPPPGEEDDRPTIRAFLRWTINPEIGEGVIQTIANIRQTDVDHDIADTLQGVVDFISTIDHL